jgi:hypothetical protein
MAAHRSVPEVEAQQAFDEVTIEDADLKRALESRQAAKEKASESRAAYKAANEAASGEIAKLELPVGGAARCGRFRITRRGGLVREHRVYRAQREQDTTTHLGRTRICEGSGLAA